MYCHEVMAFEADLFGLLKPSHLLRFFLHSCSVQLTEEGSAACLDGMKMPTGWMLARLTQEQYCPVYSGDKLEFHCSYRQQSGAAYLREVQAVRGGNTVAVCRMLWMLVDLQERRILRPKELEPLFGQIPVAEGIAPVPRTTLPVGMKRQEIHPVRYSECDRNGHYSSPNYIDLICDSFGFWKTGARLIRKLSIDYHSEFLPEENVELLGIETENRIAVRGQHADGRGGFSAVLHTAELVS